MIVGQQIFDEELEKELNQKVEKPKSDKATAKPKKESTKKPTHHE